jgi:hypothetical protein
MKDESGDGSAVESERGVTHSRRDRSETNL